MPKPINLSLLPITQKLRPCALQSAKLNAHIPWLDGLITSRLIVSVFRAKLKTGRLARNLTRQNLHIRHPELVSGPPYKSKDFADSYVGS